MRALTQTTSCLLLVAAILAAGVCEAARRSTVEVKVETGPARVSIGSDGLSRIALDGAAIAALPGQPMMPARTVRIAVPPDIDPSTLRVDVRPKSVEVLPGFHEIAPAPPRGIIGRGGIDWAAEGRTIVDGRDVEVYRAARLFPASWGEAISGVSRLRRHRFVEVALTFVRYDPVAGAVEVARELEIALSFERASRSRGDAFDDCRHEDLARRTLLNYEESLAWHGEACPSPPPDEAWRNVAIITTDSILDASLVLDDYVQMREDEDRAVTIATEDQWDETTGGMHDSRADRIRKWLADNHVALELAYVLLIGNPDPNGGVLHGVPMKLCVDYEGEIAPTDYYYSNLSSDWDGDADGVFCELEDNVGFTPDVYVGRIPVYSDGAVAADEILARIIEYEQTSLDGDLEWRRRMMLPNSIYFFENQDGGGNPRWDGATVGEWFVRDELRPRGMEWTTLYEHEGLEASAFWSHFQVTAQEVVDQWVRGYGLVFWTGHGSDTGVYRSIWNTDNGNGYAEYGEMSSPNFMEATYSHMLADAPRPFVVHGSCSNGTPETANNLGYSLLRRGAIGTVSASRPAITWHWPDADPEMWEKPESWNGDVIDIVTEYSHLLLDGTEAGRALEDAIFATSNYAFDPMMTWYQKTIQNLYGDPMVRLVMCREDADCDNERYCDGEETCDDGACMPGEPVECEPSGDCDTWVCDEASDECVPSPEECPEPDAGPPDTDSEDTDTDTDADASFEPEVTGAKSSCAMFEGAPRRSLLTALLAASL